MASELLPVRNVMMTSGTGSQERGEAWRKIP